MFNNSYKHLYTHTNILFSNIIIIGLSYTRKLADCILWFIHIIFSVFNFGVNLLSRAVVSIISRSSLLFVYNFNYSTDDIWQRYARTHIAPAFIVTDKSPRHRVVPPADDSSQLLWSHSGHPVSAPSPAPVFPGPSSQSQPRIGGADQWQAASLSALAGVTTTAALTRVSDNRESRGRTRMDDFTLSALTIHIRFNCTE